MLISTGDIVRVLSINARRLDRWVNDGLLTPVRIGDGRGSRFGYTLSDVLAVAVAIELRRRGFSLNQSANVCQWLLQKTLDELRADWKAGRTLLLAVGDVEPFPKLLSREAVFNNPAIDLQAALNAGVPVAVIDVAEACRQLTLKLESKLPELCCK